MAEMRTIESVLHEEIDKLEELSRRDIGLTGTPSGFADIDDLTGGFQPGNLIVLAARPSMGKSTLATNIAENAAIDHGKPVALFSLEMSETELAHRFIASQAKVSSDELRKGRVKADRWPKVLRAVEKLAAAPIFIDDSSDIGVLEMRAKARRLHARHGGLGLIVVDYLQLVRPDGRSDSRVEQVGQISRGLKILARELDIPVIAVSQLSRAVESRHPPIPMLSDLRESGQLEQDADVVMFVYREEYYDQESERLGEADIIFAKHRNGPIGKVALSFLPKYPRFASLYRDHSAVPAMPDSNGAG
jgi:replicative DNA helicase